MSRDDLALFLIDGLIAGAFLAKHRAASLAKLRALFAQLSAEGRDPSAEEMADIRADALLADVAWDLALNRARGAT